VDIAVSMPKYRFPRKSLLFTTLGAIAFLGGSLLMLPETVD